MDYKYNEHDYAKYIYEHGFKTNHLATELGLVATYMRRELNYKPQKLQAEMYGFCEKHLTGYSHARHYKIINSAIAKATKKGSCLTHIRQIDIRKYELDYLLHTPIYADTPAMEYHCRKLMFTLLVLTKLNHMVLALKNPDKPCSESFKGGSRKYRELKSVAKIPERVNIHTDLINSLATSGKITVLFNGLIHLDFIKELRSMEPEGDKDKGIVLELSNFETIGWYFDYYNKKPKVKLCKHCGQPFAQLKGNRQEYCSDECVIQWRREYNRQKKQLYRM